MLAGGVAYACVPYYYSAADNRIYRLLPPLYKPSSSVCDDFATKNIMLWSRQTGCRDTAAIRQAIYEGSLAQWENLNSAAKSFQAGEDWFGDNAFVRHLSRQKDVSAIELLRLSKRYECIRNAQRSPWYYNSRVGTNEGRDLKELYTQVRQHEPYGGKYADRWRFIAIKCAWATGEREEAIELWEKWSPKMKDNIFYDEAEDYVARCLTELGRMDEAFAIYSKHQTWVDKLPNVSFPSRLQMMLQLYPNSKEFAPMLQDYLSKLDWDHAATYSLKEYDNEYYKTDSILWVARRAISDPRVRQKAMWRYTVACILDYQGHQSEALEMLDGAEDGDGNAFLQKSVRTLQFYLHVRTDSITDAFEQYAIREIQWLDKEIVLEWNRIPEEIRMEISHDDGACYNITKLNNLFFYASLSRIVLEDSVGLAWRMVDATRCVRALQMANVASNYVIKLSNNDVVEESRKGKVQYYIWYCREDNILDDIISSLTDTAAIDGHNFSYHEYRWNNHDYSNSLSDIADRMDAKTLEQYRQRQLHPKDVLDRWFNERGYTDGNYWQDMIGTHYLRERNYAAAITHLQYVSPSYQRCMNQRFYLNPFCIDRSGISHDSTQYKLHFAQRMDSLQRAMLGNGNADDRGLAMLEYTIGLENSFGMCWWLTSYQKSCSYDVKETRNGLDAQIVVKLLRRKALLMLKSPDAKARYHLRLGHYDIVGKKYADTPTGKHLALVCDEVWQYRTNPS